MTGLSTISRLLGLVAVSALLVGGPAFAQDRDDDHHDRGHYDRGHYDRGQADWRYHENHARDWRYHHRYVEGGPGYVYTPPAVVYAPPPGPPSLNVFIPLHF